MEEKKSRRKNKEETTRSLFKVPIYLALIHYPVYNRNKKVIVTSITTFDIHDISRIAKTYELSGVFIVNPLRVQRDFVEEVIRYWTVGFGSSYNEIRKIAMELVKVESTLENVKSFIERKHGKEPISVTTSAKFTKRAITYEELREKIAELRRPLLLIFGTGWGIEERTKRKADLILLPIYGRGDYNHLSVRSAVAIILDRLLGRED